MRVPYKHVLLLLAINLSLTINSCKSRLEGNTDIYQQAVNLIINNSKDLPLKKEVIFISDETIPFNLETLSVGIVQKKYITDYDEVKEYSEYELKKIDQVKDSLSQKSKLYNLNFKRNQKNAVSPKHNRLSNKTKYVCFFHYNKKISCIVNYENLIILLILICLLQSNYLMGLHIVIYLKLATITLLFWSQMGNRI